MAFRTDPRFAQPGLAVPATDEGLRSYMLSVYNYMGLGLAITGLVALVVASTPALYVPIFTTPLKWVVMLAPLGFVFFLGARIQSMSVSAAQLTFWLFAAVMGMSMASIFLVFTGESIARVFFITAAHLRRGEPVRLHHQARPDRHGLVPVHGPDRHRHREPGQHLHRLSSALQFAVSVIGVLVFTGLTAWDTQRLKNEYLGSLQTGGDWWPRVRSWARSAST